MPQLKSSITQSHVKDMKGYVLYIGTQVCIWIIRSGVRLEVLSPPEPERFMGHVTIVKLNS